MALSRTSLVLLCFCIGLLLLVDVTAAREQPEEKADATGSATQQMYLRGNTMGAMTEGTPLTEDNAEASSDSFGAVDVNDYGSTPAKANCRPKPCRR